MSETNSRSLEPRPSSADTKAPVRARRWGWMLLCLIGFAGAGVLGWTNAGLLRDLEAERVAKHSSEAEAQRQATEARQIKEELATLQEELESIAASGNQTAEEALRRQREMEKTRRAQSVSQQELEVALTNAKAEQDGLLSRIGRLEAQVEQLGQELVQAKQREEALNESVAQSRRLTEALQAQLLSKEQTLKTLERSYQRFKDSSQSASRQLEVISRTLSELETLNQRRARVLEQATRRLKDLSDSYRTVAVRIDSDPRTQGTLNAEVSRLQSGVLAVEDQVAQFNTLNTQASQLERKLGDLRDAN
ncbi:MAG: hypothetical protein MUF01_01640 [Bryobacterales bacterium]|nr:hypothetical protein [Bryobacterales bacterium]